MPSGGTAGPHITDNKDGTVTVRYSPTERGFHEMHIKYDGTHIPGETPAGSRLRLGFTCFRTKLIKSCAPHPAGSPLQFYVDAINSGHVTAYGPGLSHSTVNRPATFTIVTEDAGEGGPTCWGILSSDWLQHYVGYFSTRLSLISMRTGQVTVCHQCYWFGKLLTD